jgi:hypothetical protein
MRGRRSARKWVTGDHNIFFLLAKTGKDWQKLAKSMVYDESVQNQ